MTEKMVLQKREKDISHHLYTHPCVEKGILHHFTHIVVYTNVWKEIVVASDWIGIPPPPEYHVRQKKVPTFEISRVFDGYE